MQVKKEQLEPDMEQWTSSKLGKEYVKAVYCHPAYLTSMLIDQLGRICLQCRRPWVDSWVRKICWRRDRLCTPVLLGFPCGSAGKGSACNVGDLGLILALGRSPGEGKDYPLQCSGLEKSRDYTVHGVTKSRTRLSIFHFQCGLVQ